MMVLMVEAFIRYYSYIDAVFEVCCHGVNTVIGGKDGTD